MAFCENCGTKMQDDARFCANCGAKQEQRPVPPVVQESPKVYQSETYQPETYQSVTHQPEAQQSGAYQAGAAAGAAAGAYTYQQSAGEQKGYQQNAYQQNAYQQNAYQQSANTQQRTYEPDGDPRVLSVGALTMFAYSGILFLIPLLVAKNSRFARFHAGQGLTLLIAGAVYGIASAILSGIAVAIAPGFGIVLGILFSLGALAFPVLILFGIIHVCKGEMKPLPIIGGIQLIKL